MSVNLCQTSVERVEVGVSQSLRGMCHTFDFYEGARFSVSNGRLISARAAKTTANRVKDCWRKIHRNSDRGPIRYEVEFEESYDPKLCANICATWQTVR